MVTVHALHCSTATKDKGIMISVKGIIVWEVCYLEITDNSTEDYYEVNLISYITAITKWWTKRQSYPDRRKTRTQKVP